MAQLFKGHIIDDGQYPMPRPARPEPTAAAGSATGGAGAESQIDAAEIKRAAGDLEQVLTLVGSLRPAVEQMADALRSGAQQQGYADGIARAQAEVHQQLMEAIAALTDAQHQRHAIAEQNESALADLALRIARKVIGAHLDADPTLVARIVAETVAELEPTTALVVRVNPADHAAVEASRTDIERLVGRGGKIEIVADDAVDHGGCVLVSPAGEVDARIETKLSVLETAFTAQRRQMVDGLGA